MPRASRFRSLLRKRRLVHHLWRAGLVIVPAGLFAASAVVTDDAVGGALAALLIFGGPASAIVVARWTLSPRPRLILLLRPFDHATVSAALRRFVRNELSFVGVVITLADSQLAAPRWRDSLLSHFFRLGGPLVAWLAPPRLSAETRSSLQDLERVVNSPRHIAWLWLLARDHLLRVPASNRFWRDAVVVLLRAADVIVVDVSSIGAGSAWELQLVRNQAHVVFVAKQGHRAEAGELVTKLFPADSDRLFAYRPNGTAMRTEALLETIERWF